MRTLFIHSLFGLISSETGKPLTIKTANNGPEKIAENEL